ncbi:hypothetical protein BKA70DRAFT_1303056 [Coprinopsis sp. MPI-PUGE-AT-0042]|nr:hypothetical protein BKA70DRAFT_1303056 [Coprinopsis sp. MPI-PUGE-AT-0042]
MIEYSWEERLLVASRVRIFNWMSTSALVIWVLEYLSTVQLEITYVWPAPWSLVKPLYFVNRYMVVIPVCLCLYSQTVPLENCFATFLASSSSMIVCIGVSETLLFLRVWALADRNKKVMLFLFAFLSASQSALSASLVCFILFFRSMEYAPSPARSITNCVLMKSADKVLIAAFALILVEQALVMSMCIYLGKRRHLGTSSPLIRTFFVDGAVYFVVLALMSMANLFCLLATPNGYQFVLAAHQGVAHSTLTNRMFLNLRKLAAKDTEYASELVTRELDILNALQRTNGTGFDTITTRSTHPHPQRDEFELRNRPLQREYASDDDLVEDGRGERRETGHDPDYGREPSHHGGSSGIELTAISKRGGTWVSPPTTPTVES